MRQYLVSKTFKGSISGMYKELTRQSSLLALIEPDDQVMANKGFDIQDLLTPIGESLVMPPKLKTVGVSNECGNIHRARAVANLRIHVERAV